jgi:tRNA(Ser,Leu) C12 N-acetylase TAN1
MDPTPAPADWNVVVTSAEDSFRDAVRMLGKWGRVKRTNYYNVLGLRVADPGSFLDDFAAAVAASPGILNFVSHVVPAQETFDFSTAEEFETRARAIALAWAPKLSGKSFHVRLHRRGFKGVLSTHREEQFLADALLTVLQGAGRIAFTDPDAIIQIETIDGRAGMSLRTRDDIRRFPFLGTVTLTKASEAKPPL